MRALTFVLLWEGGWSDNPPDPPTMKGITLATYTQWRAAQGYAPPSKAALKEITDEEVEAIYWYLYWQAGGCEMLKWPLSAVHFDACVNTGVGQAQTFLTQSKDNLLRYMAARIDFLTRTNDAWWATNGRGVVRRCADLMKLAAG